ncbi:unnamed protein product [Protopolystoma xenopodis]|uniref:Uncharacterized protein n=1 Tax=Protopolystoma xenopodis TaxID=117903 RepID=A0A448XGE9_9PLAT|nr:unnamed protein product [Protopolystoma xenopodis]
MRTIECWTKAQSVFTRNEGLRRREQRDSFVHFCFALLCHGSPSRRDNWLETIREDCRVGKTTELGRVVTGSPSCQPEETVCLYHRDRQHQRPEDVFFLTSCRLALLEPFC